MKNIFPRKVSSEEYRIFADICVTSSQVTFGVAFASLLIPPLDLTKQFAIIISSILTVILWLLAWFFARRIKKD